MYFLRDKANLQPGERVLINGASGSIGTHEVQLAKHLGAHVTGVCSTRNIDLVRSHGADQVIDYTKQSIKDTNERYDIIFDTVGRTSFSATKKSLPPGRFLATTGLHNYLLAAWTTLRPGPKVLSGMSTTKTPALTYLKDLITTNPLKITIDSHYPLPEVTKAHHKAQSGQKPATQ